MPRSMLLFLAALSPVTSDSAPYPKALCGPAHSQWP